MKRQNKDWINKAAERANMHYRKCQAKHADRNYNSREARRDFERFVKHAHWNVRASADIDVS